MDWASVVKKVPPQPREVASSDLKSQKTSTSEVVVDTNALIRGVHLDRVAERAVTVGEVLSEVRDKKARAWLERMPFGIEVEEPQEADLKAVAKFAQATGDLTFLSRVDLKVMALARTRERLANGTKNIVDFPGQVRVQPKTASNGASMPGWGTVPNPEDWKAVDELNELADQGDMEPMELSSQSRILNSLEGLSLSNPVEEQSNSGEDIVPAAQGGAHQQMTVEPAGQEAVGETLAGADVDQSEIPMQSLHGEENCKDDDWQVVGKDPGRKSHGKPGAHNPSSTVDSIDSCTHTKVGAVQSNIGCMTSDFSMQNVLIQMGLKVLSPDGRRIREVKRWAMRCSGCFTVTKEVGRIFCSKCGNASLEKVEVQTGPNGTQVFGVKTKHCLRGTKYSLPMPKGGKKNKDPILSEDVMKDRLRCIDAPRKDSSLDAFAPEFSEDTWFKMSDSRQPMRSLLPNRRNPNERRNGKRRK